MSETETIETTTSDDSTSIFSSATAFHAALEKVQNGESVEESVAAEPEQEDSVEPEAAAEEEQVQADPDEDDYDFIETEKGKMIPKGRFSKEIQKRKTLEARFNEEREARIRTETELENLKKGLESFYGKQAPDTVYSASHDDLDSLAPIDPETAKYFDKKIRELERKLQESNQETAATKQKINEESLKTYIERDEAEFKRSHPDLYDAVNHIFDIKTREYQSIGFDHANAKQAAEQELRGKFTAIASTRRQSPSQWIYEHAQEFFGYKPKGGAPVKPESNFKKLQENVKKTSSIADIPVANTRSTGIGGDDLLNAAKREDGSVDPKKFALLLQKARESR